jgi:hypothetical protein
MGRDAVKCSGSIYGLTCGNAKQAIPRQRRSLARLMTLRSQVQILARYKDKRLSEIICEGVFRRSVADNVGVRRTRAWSPRRRWSVLCGRCPGPRPLPAASPARSSAASPTTPIAIPAGARLSVACSSYSVSQHSQMWTAPQDASNRHRRLMYQPAAWIRSGRIRIAWRSTSCLRGVR